jgi:lysophospholipase L1-like esterase
MFNLNPKDSAKTILCYGDSNTWGNVPRSDKRYPRSMRWPSVLQKLLGKNYEVISEGLCGRTLCAVDPSKPHRTGITHLQAILESADPISLVIIMLGTNDMKSTYGLSAEEIASHLKQTIALIQGDIADLENTPKILVVCPPAVVHPAKESTGEGKELDARMHRAIEISKVLPNHFKEVAWASNCEFINSQEYISSSDIDGYHLDPESHVKLARVIRETISRLSI